VSRVPFVRLRRPQLTGRAMMIAAMALFLVVILAPALQTYLSRRSAVEASQQQQRELEEHITQLKAQNDLWDDPAYVERKARERLQYIRPGDTLYTVLNPDGTPRDGSTSSLPSTAKPPEAAWNAKLWSSVRTADNAK